MKGEVQEGLAIIYISDGHYEPLLEKKILTLKNKICAHNEHQFRCGEYQKKKTMWVFIT